MLVFIKHYDPFKQSLSYVGKMYFLKDSKIQEIPKQVIKAVSADLCAQVA